MKTRDPNAGRRAAAKRWAGLRAHRTSFSPETALAIIDSLREGLPPETAAEVAGVHPSTLLRWRQKGERYIEDGEPAEHADYGVFVSEFRKARAEFFRELIDEAVNAETPARWRRALSILARRDRRNWAVTAPSDDAWAHDADPVDAALAYL